MYLYVFLIETSCLKIKSISRAKRFLARMEPCFHSQTWEGTTVEDVWKTRVASVTQTEIEMLMFKVFKLKDKNNKNLNSIYPRHPVPPPEVRYDWTPKTYY